MRILFFVTGIGYGDATRVHAVIDEILKKEPEAKFLIAGYDCSLDYFKGKYRTIKISGYRMPGREMRFTLGSFIANNYMLPFVWLFTTFRLKKEIKKFNPDIIVTDFEPAAITMAKSINKKSIALYGFDPELYRQYSREHKPNRLMRMESLFLRKVYDMSDYSIVVSLIKRKKSLVYNYVEPIVRVKPQQLLSEAKLMKELNLDRRPILVMLGGSHFGIALAKSLAKISMEFNDMFILFGSGAEIEQQKNLRYIPFSEDLLKYLKVSKGIITLAGQNTLSEGLVFRKPMLVFPIQNHVEQQLNCYAINDYIMTGRNIMPEALKKTVGEFISRIPAMRYDAEKINLNAGGASQAADIILRVAKK
ncbi:MAG: glycosyltransferase family protein [Candidatus Nanoarchaeia archaeon]|nr:glycosyltransferase family protein [Candidatus Nanoarchaeia archaeon]